MSDHAGRLDAMRIAAPLVQNITNYVAMNVMANVMLAAGASPAMVHAREEVAEFATIASALTINIGTLTPAWVDGMVEAAKAASEAGTPWVLDPVAVGATSYRYKTAQRLLAFNPTVTRGNASEIIVLSGAAKTGKGVGATDDVDRALLAARSIAQRTGGIVAVTGAEDFVTDGTREAWVANGHPIMPAVTALGCALNGIVAAFLATGDDAFEATITALAYYGLAGEQAGETAQGPGSFAVAFLDALAGMDADRLQAGAKIRRV